ncbi:MAG: hypothetical protein RLZZ502_1603 [Pseudomonadota bacterium]|jgi:multiple sugar transport system permease protein
MHPKNTQSAGALLKSERWYAALFLLPALLGFVLFHAWPMLKAMQMSFYEWNLLQAPKLIYFDNYSRLLSDERFWNGMKLSALYVLLNIPVQIGLGLFVAVAMDRVTRSLWVKTVVVMPYLLSNVLVAMMWLWLLDPFLGWVNEMITLLGFERQAFFGAEAQALATVAGVNIWRHVGLVSLLFLAGLQNIPKTLYQAASLEGAGEWQLFRHITLPLLRPVMVFVLVTSVTGSFQIFDTIAVTTKGGPLDSTNVIVHAIVQSAFSFYQMGYASAMAVVLTLCMFAYTLLQMKIMRASESDLA